MISIPLCHDCYVFVAICLIFTFLSCVIVLQLELEPQHEVINNILYIVLLQGIIYYLKHAFLKMVLRQSISIVFSTCTYMAGLTLLVSVRPLGGHGGRRSPCSEAAYLGCRRPSRRCRARGSSETDGARTNEQASRATRSSTANFSTRGNEPALLSRRPVLRRARQEHRNDRRGR